MKTIVKRTTAVMLFAAVMTMGLVAQGQNNVAPNRSGEVDYQNFNRCMNLPNLTDEQSTQLKELRLERIQASQKYRNQMGEVRARQRTLMSETPLNQKALDKLIDEKTGLMNSHLKEGIAHKAAVNEILTEEQQVYLNQMQSRRQQFARRGAGRGAGTGFHAGQGRGGAGKGNFVRQGRGMRGGTARGQNNNFRGQN